MLDRLEAVAARYDEINHKLMEPNVTNDQELYTSLKKIPGIPSSEAVV